MHATMRLPRILLLALLVAAVAGLTLTRATALAARRVGQQDDITVLTLSRSHGDGVVLGQRVVAVTA